VKSRARYAYLCPKLKIINKKKKKKGEEKREKRRVLTYKAII
jgi:hypothetical protein